MSTRLRKPRYFPRMKVRGARRRDRTDLERMVGAFERVLGAGSLMSWQVNFLADVRSSRLTHNPTYRTLALAEAHSIAQRGTCTDG